MPGLDQLLSRVIERKGFTVQGADNEALFARKGDDALLAAWKTDGPLTAEEATIFLAAMEQVRATSGVVVAVKGADQAAKDALAGNKAIEVWAESRLVVEVGEAFVREALEKPAASAGPTPFPSATPAPAAAPRTPTKFPSLVAQAASAAGGNNSGAAMYMPNRKKEQPADMQATIPQRGQALGYAWGGAVGGTTSAGIAKALPSKPRLQTDQWGNVVNPAKAAANALPAALDNGDVEIVGGAKVGRRRAAPAPAPPAVIDADEEAYEILPSRKEKAAPAATTVVRDASPPACTTLKLALTKEEALSKSGKAGTPKLALVPHVAFEYDVEMNRPGMTAPVTGKGAVLVNSITGELRNVGGLDFADAEPSDARKDAEKMTAVDVYDKVKGFMSKTFSRTMNVERELAGNTVMETLKLTPDPDEMGLQHRGIVHVPVWEITSSTGVTKVDAYTGDVLA